MILADAINLVLADHPVPGTPSVAVEKTSGVLHDLIPGTEDFWHYMTGAKKVTIPRI